MQEVPDVELYGVVGYVELICDLLIGAPVEYEPQQACLALRETIGGGKGYDVIRRLLCRHHIYRLEQTEEHEYAYDKQQGHHRDKGDRLSAQPDADSGAGGISEPAPHEAHAGKPGKIRRRA